MLAPQASLRAAVYHLFTYGEYIYGFPFYGLSAILLVPVKWIFKTGLASHTQLNMLIVRQLVCVLPSVLSAFLLTYLATRFKKWIPSLGLFLVVLTLPGMLWYITRFWHPDALNLLFVSLTLFYLDRDQLEFRRTFSTRPLPLDSPLPPACLAFLLSGDCRLVGGRGVEKIIICQTSAA